MTCTCCGAEMELPGGLVATAPKVSTVLCGACGERWGESPEGALHRQLVGLGQWVVAVSQFQSWQVLEARRAA